MTNNANFYEKRIDRLVVSIRRQARQFGLIAKGGHLTDEGSKFDTPDYAIAKAGDDVIDFGEGLLLSFADESNLIQTKSKNDRLRQRRETLTVFAKKLFIDPSAPEKNHDFLITLFTNNLQNILDVTENSREILMLSFSGEEVEEQNGI